MLLGTKGKFLARIGRIALLLALGFAPRAGAQTAVWTRQTGTPDYDYAYAVAVDGTGNAYITGTTYGSLGQPNEGSSDLFLAKYDPSGAQLWMRQTGTPDGDEGYGVAVDAAGNAYVIGITYGSIGGPVIGNQDAYLAKFDSAGDLLWARQIGTPMDDFITGVALDRSGNAYVTGLTYGDLGGPNADPTNSTTDVYLGMFSPAGTLLWMQQTGTPVDDFANGVAMDGAGNAYVTGATLGNLAGLNAGLEDLFLAKFNGSGTLLWTRQAGTPASDGGNAVGVDGAGNAYIAGTTTGSLGGPNAGAVDAFLTKYDPSGAVLWSRQTGSHANDYANSLAVDGAGNAFITGATLGSLAGPSAGGADVFLISYSPSGASLWTRQFGSSTLDWGYGVAVDGRGNAYVVGSTNGSLGGPNAGLDDLFLAKFAPPACVADMDDGSGTGTPDGGVTIDDLLYYLAIFDAGAIRADVDDGTATGTPDGGVTIDDLLYYLFRFDVGC